MPIFDAHLHIIDPRFPLTPNQGYVPDPFSVSDYKLRTGGLGVSSGAVVSGSFQGFDQTYLTAALDALGPGFVGVTQLPVTTSARVIQELDAQGVRAVRFNLHRGGSADARDMLEFGQRIYDQAGWHVEVYAGHAALHEVAAKLLALPKVSVDHLGLEAASLPLVLKLAEAGVRIKACGFGRLDCDPLPVMQKIDEVNPASLMFGSDLPSTRAPRAFADTDLHLVQEAFSDAALYRMLWKNAREFYGLDG